MTATDNDVRLPTELATEPTHAVRRATGPKTVAFFAMKMQATDAPCTSGVDGLKWAWTATAICACAACIFSSMRHPHGSSKLRTGPVSAKQMPPIPAVSLVSDPCHVGRLWPQRRFPCWGPQSPVPPGAPQGVGVPRGYGAEVNCSEQLSGFSAASVAQTL